MSIVTLESRLLDGPFDEDAWSNVSQLLDAAVGILDEECSIEESLEDIEVCVAFSSGWQKHPS